MEHSTAQDYSYMSNRTALFDSPDIFGMVKSIRLATNLFRLSAWLAEWPKLEFVKVHYINVNKCYFHYLTKSHFETAEERATFSSPRDVYVN